MSLLKANSSHRSVQCITVGPACADVTSIKWALKGAVYLCLFHLRRYWKCLYTNLLLEVYMVLHRSDGPAGDSQMEPTCSGSWYLCVSYMILIYLLTAIWLSPGGSTHLHTNNLPLRNLRPIYRTGVPLPSRCCILYIFLNKYKYGVFYTCCTLSVFLFKMPFIS